MDLHRFLLTIEKKTEVFLTWRKRRQLKKKEKLSKKNVVVDWVEAFLSAVIIVFFLNQYLLQAYQIPTQSMVHTLEIGDRIFVDKITYGPELLPGLIKFPGFRTIKRGDIAIFESPEYRSKGTVNDIITRIIYMMTFSFVDLDRDDKGEPAKHFLIKRVPGVPGDRLRIRQGFLEIMPRGKNNWIPEEELKTEIGLTYTLNKRFFDDFQYKKYTVAGKSLALKELSLTLDQEQEDAFSSLFLKKIAKDDDALRILRKQYENRTSMFIVIESDPGYKVIIAKEFFDFQFLEKIKYQTFSQIRPHDTQVKKEYLKKEVGRYIPKGYIFPMGDNRDNSRDARVFGPVKIKKVLGKSFFRFWPFNRFGGI